MVIVCGKAKNLLDKAKESCLLAVDVYNNPKTVSVKNSTDRIYFI